MATGEGSSKMGRKPMTHKGKKQKRDMDKKQTKYDKLRKIGLTEENNEVRRN